LDDLVEYQRAFQKHHRSLAPRKHSFIPGLVLALFVIAIYCSVVYLPDLVAPLPKSLFPLPPALFPQPTPVEAFVRLFVPFVAILLLIIGFVLWLRYSKWQAKNLLRLNEKMLEPQTVEITN